MNNTEFGGAPAAANAREWQLALPVALMALQVVAAAYFVIDGIEDQFLESPGGFNLDLAMEFVIALALLVGVIVSSRNFIRLRRELEWKEQSLARLRGAAAGTIRSQLSQIYSKAGVSSQAMLVSVFIDDLLDGPLAAGEGAGAPSDA